MRGKKREIPEGMTYDQWYYQNLRKPRPSRKKNKDQRCLLCDIKILSKYGSKTRRLYCDDCATHPQWTVQRYRLYWRRGYQKRASKKLEPIRAENILV